MSFLNRVELIGNLGKDPEVLKVTAKGKFVRLNIATSKKYMTAKGGLEINTQWHKVYVSNGSGKYAASYFVKGAKVLIAGELRTREWTDKTGKKHLETAVYSNECKLFAKKPVAKDEESLPVEKPSAAEVALKEMRKVTA